MPDAIQIRLLEVLGKPIAVSDADGQALHDRVAPLLRSGQAVTLCFSGMEITTPTFFNAAVGQLSGQFDHEKIRALLSVREAVPDDLVLLKRVVENAKHYFAERSSRTGTKNAGAGTVEE